MRKTSFFAGIRAVSYSFCLSLLTPLLALAQSTGSSLQPLPLDDMSSFKPVADNWQIVGEVNFDRNDPKKVKTSKGKGILVNIPTEKNKDNLVTQLEHGDLDLDIDFMMAPGSNSGIYLQGRYEVQLLDSWGVKNPTSGDCGGIYKRRDLSKPDGQREYEGHAPRVNISRAPGLWQNFKISFQAPRFNEKGEKIENAKILRVEHNGVTIHENVELTGPTGGPISEDEKPTGPLLFQGDHGTVAFRNIRYQNYIDAPVTLSEIKYGYYTGKYEKAPDFSKLKAVKEGATPEITWALSNSANNFGLRFNGKLNVKQPGRYIFLLQAGGNSELKVNNKTVIPFNAGYGERMGAVDLQSGEHPFELVYTKHVEWERAALGLFVEGPGVRRQTLHALGSIPFDDPVNPILLTVASEPMVTRSFMDFEKREKGNSRRISHAASVGHPEKIHYTMDLKNGALVQVWKGDFLNATPMWHSRGDGSSRPLGSVILLNDAPALAVLNDKKANWPDTLGNDAAYRFRGYDLDEKGQPVFKYTAYGVDTEDKITPEEGGKMLTRELKLKGQANANLYVRVAEGAAIEEISKGNYSVNNNEYYIQLADNSGVKPMIRSVNKGKELVIPVTAADKGTAIKYSIVW